MAITKEVKYYLEGGDVTKPFVETILRNPANVIVGKSRISGPGDVEITEQEYNNYLAALEVGYKASIATQAAARETKIETLKSDIQAAMLSTGMTQQQLDDLFNLLRE